ncbi:hypothetical protein [Frankia sp. CiP3]|uniref:IS1634 family transposase n=1 Tax=Frankia sp. CiP3 TaxID=2880971 RepID=UPI001EF5FCE1|nr:hypothetical protein [Frankia sp. CiP3]
MDGKPRIVSQRYLGSAEDIAAAMAAREATMLPERTRHLAFGDVAAVWGVLARLGVADVVDEVTRARRADAGASVGTYLALAALNRVVAPCSKSAFADWWATTAADRFTKIENRVLDHRRFWNAMQAVTRAELAEIERRLALRAAEIFELDISAVALDMTNFATYIDSTNAKAPLAQRGKAKQKRYDLRIVGLGLVVTRDGGIPLVSHTYPGNKPDVTPVLRTFVQCADSVTSWSGGVVIALVRSASGLARFAACWRPRTSSTGPRAWRSSSAHCPWCVTYWSAST